MRAKDYLAQQPFETLWGLCCAPSWRRQWLDFRPESHPPSGHERLYELLVGLGFKHHLVVSRLQHLQPIGAEMGPYFGVCLELR